MGDVAACKCVSGCLSRNVMQSCCVAVVIKNVNKDAYVIGTVCKLDWLKSLLETRLYCRREACAGYGMLNFEISFSQENRMEQPGVGRQQRTC